MNEFIFFIGGVFFGWVSVLIVAAIMANPPQRRPVSRTMQRYTSERKQEDSNE